MKKKKPNNEKTVRASVMGKFIILDRRGHECVLTKIERVTEIKGSNERLMWKARR